MIELQVLNKVLADKSMSMLRQNGIGGDYFTQYKDEFEYIDEHVVKYGTVPDKETFLARFPDFDLLQVTEPERYLVETLHEQYMFTQIVPVIQQSAKMVETDARDAAKYLLEKAQKLMMQGGFRPGYDLIANAKERAKEYDRRVTMEGLLGISTGLDELDKMTHGWLNEDLISIVGRTNMGKTWVMLFFLVMAWKKGKPVLLYSGEMSKDMVGFRFDTLNAGFSNLGLMSGSKNLGTEGEPVYPDKYFQYITNLGDCDVPFIVVTPKDFGRRPTVLDINELIEKYKPAIVGIDQISLMEDYRARRGDQPRTKFTHVAEDLYLSSETYGIPVLSPAQANRDAAKENKKDDQSAPGLEQIGESDGIGQNSTRVISIVQMGPVMKLALKKNRYGLNNQEILVLWDIDRGIVKPFQQNTRKDGDPKGEVVSKPLTGEDVF